MPVIKIKGRLPSVTVYSMSLIQQNIGVLLSNNYWEKLHSLIVPQVIMKPAPTTGNKRKRWAAVYCLIWVYMPYRVQDLVRAWNRSPLLLQKHLPPGLRYIKMG